MSDTARIEARSAGSCLCGAVRYEVAGEPGPIVFCHCSRCRKANGSAFLAAAPVQAANLRIVSGEELLGEYQSSPGLHRVFCRVCASPLFSRRDAIPDVLPLRIGTLDTPVQGKTTAHIFAASRAEWFDILDDAPQYATRPEG